MTAVTVARCHTVDIQPWQTGAVLTQFRFVAVFATVFIAVYACIEWGRIHGITPWLVHWLMLEPAAIALNFLQLADTVSADGVRLVSPQLRLNVLPGCEGTEAWALLVAAIIAMPLPWRRKLLGAVTGSALVCILNLIRMIVLYWAALDDRPLFNALHGYIAPTVIVIALSLFFLGLCSSLQRDPA